MIAVDVSYIRRWGVKLIDVFLGAYDLVVLFRVVKSDRKDRAFLFVVLALVAFPLGLFVIRLIGFSLPAFVLWLSLFFGLALAAVCFGIRNWQRRTKHVGWTRS